MKTPEPLSLGDRLRALRKRLGWTQVTMASVAGIERSAWNNYEADRREPSFEILRRLIAKTGVEWEWLMVGKGRMLEMDTDPFLPVDLPQPIVHFASSLKARPEGINVPEYLAVPLLSDPVAAGEPEVQSGMFYEYAWIHRSQVKRRKNLVAFRIDGDSMSPLIRDGDIVAIDKADKNPPGIFACRYEGGVTVKRVRLIGNSLLCIPENRAHEERIVTLREGQSINEILLGRAVWQWSDVTKL